MPRWFWKNISISGSSGILFATGIAAMCSLELLIDSLFLFSRDNLCLLVSVQITTKRNLSWNSRKWTNNLENGLHGSNINLLYLINSCLSKSSSVSFYDLKLLNLLPSTTIGNLKNYQFRLFYQARLGFLWLHPCQRHHFGMINY